MNAREGHSDVPIPVVGIEEDVDAGELRQGLEDFFEALIGEAQRDRILAAGGEKGERHAPPPGPVAKLVDLGSLPALFVARA